MKMWVPLAQIVGPGDGAARRDVREHPRDDICWEDVRCVTCVLRAAGDPDSKYGLIFSAFHEVVSVFLFEW